MVDGGVLLPYLFFSAWADRRTTERELTGLWVLRAGSDLAGWSGNEGNKRFQEAARYYPSAAVIPLPLPRLWYKAGEARTQYYSIDERMMLQSLKLVVRGHKETLK